MVALAHPVSSESDTLLASQISVALRERDAVAFERVRVRSESGIITLTGLVSSWYARSLAYQVAKKQSDIGRIVDALRVRQPPRSIRAH